MAKRYKKSEPLNRWVALVMALISIFMGTLFSYTLLLNQPVTKEEAIATTCIFKDFSGHQKLNGGFTEITLLVNDNSFKFIDNSCVSDELLKKLKETKTGAKLKLLVNPNNDYVIELIANDEVLLDFDTAQEDLKNNGIGFFVLGLVMYSFAIIFIFQAVLDFKKKIKRIKAKKKTR